MTERLYYTQPYLSEFDATVVGVERVGEAPAVVLDRTAFYPASGGQPHDTGRLNVSSVIDVIDRDGAVVHVVDEPLAPGDAVRGQIDWPRRFDHMQQHTGQHVLSAAFDRLHGAATVSFHLGREIATIDLDRDMASELVASAEHEANRVVWEDRPVHIRFASAEEADRLPLRKEPARTGRLRIIEVEDFDLSACGGTHVARTGAIGVIVVTGTERFRGGLRVEFRCGARAHARFRELHASVEGSLRHLSVAPAELPDAIARLQAESKELKRTVTGLAERLAAHEAVALRGRAQPSGDGHAVVEAVDGYDAAGLKHLATAITRSAGHRAVLLTRTAPHLVVVARSSDGGPDAAAVVRALTERFGGRGGGRSDLAQGGGLEGALAEILDAARTALTRASTGRR